MPAFRRQRHSELATALYTLERLANANPDHRQTIMSIICAYMPRMNAVMERWVQTCRRELLDRTLIWNLRHLLHALREFETFSDEHRPHRASPTLAR
ncbi:hypothetical protein GCM10009527_092110 [Actinomadura nitritigenes]|uniref:Integrase core domain-containing protein n=1 Tax=Actinomadura nitritigenes TaxID=134602 RepID=A0ABS3RE77_9ACTN|nr:integrase core domain-containing protein [Actinomadura nitritigenes]MBO2444521.1 integrase core domain-containing protein [Actinomadura nitritigenes]